MRTTTGSANGRRSEAQTRRRGRRQSRAQASQEGEEGAQEEGEERSQEEREEGAQEGSPKREDPGRGRRRRRSRLRRRVSRGRAGREAGARRARAVRRVFAHQLRRDARGRARLAEGPHSHCGGQRLNHDRVLQGAFRGLGRHEPSSSSDGRVKTRPSARLRKQSASWRNVQRRAKTGRLRARARAVSPVGFQGGEGEASVHRLRKHRSGRPPNYRPTPRVAISP